MDNPNPNLKVIRITTHGKIKHWVSAALEHLATGNPGVGIVLHTLPAPQTNDSPSTGAAKKGALTNVTTTISRLISVAEIIKREYMKTMDLLRNEGLHQYNEIGCLDEPPVSVQESEEARSAAILAAMDGKNHPKQKQTPFMRITLSLEAMPELAEGGATYQLPTPRRRSKGQKARAKKRHRKLAGEEGRGDNTDGNDNDQMEILEDGNVQLGPAV